MRSQLAVILASLGLLLSLYAIIVKARSQKQGYNALCDLGEHVSCTKAFSSEYGKLLLLDNAILGLFYYGLLIMLSFTSIPLFPITLPGFLASLALAYLSYVRMRNFCLVCSATYIVNVLLLLATI